MFSLAFEQHGFDLISFSVDLLLQLPLGIVLLGSVRLGLEQHMSDQEFAVAKFADLASHSLAVLVKCSFGEGSGLSEAFLADGVSAKLAPVNLFVLLESHNLAGCTVWEFVFLFVGPRRLEDDVVRLVVDLVVGAAQLKRGRFLDELV